MPEERSAVFRHVDDCPTEEWSSPTRGSVRWWEMFGGDVTATDEMVVGIAEVPVGASPPPRGHRHDATEVYVILSGTGAVVIEGLSTQVRPDPRCGFPRDSSTMPITPAPNRCDSCTCSLVIASAT